MLGAKAGYLLPTDCARRLLAELQGALDFCAERQRQLERSLRVSRRLLQVWEPVRSPSPEAETKEEDPAPACTPSAEDLKELELLTQALEKAVRVRKGVSKAGQRDGTPSLTSNAATSGATASAHSQAPSQAGSLSSGLLLQLPVAFRKAASQNSACGPSSALDTPMTPRMPPELPKLSSSTNSSHRPSAAEVRAHVQSLRKACVLLRLHMQKKLSTAPTDWMQEYGCLLTLEGLQTMVGQCLSSIQVLQAAMTEQPPGPCLVEKPTQALSLCGEVDSFWCPELLIYSSTKELQTLATLKLQVAMLDQQIHLEKVLMTELLPLINTQDPRGPPWLALCRAAYSLLCKGGEDFLTVLRDDPAD